MKRIQSFCCRRFAVLAGLFVLSTALAVPPPAGVAPVAPPPNGFDIDGNLLANTPSANIGDWVANTNLAPGTGGGVLNLAGSPIDTNRTFHIVDPYNDTSNDRIFAGGNKWLDNPNAWGWTGGKPSSKTDMNNALLHVTTDTNGHVWAVLAADRFSTSGDSYIDFELLQNPLTRNANGSFTSAGPHGGRTTNDILLSLAFTGGGKVADFFAWRWLANGSGGYTYVDVTGMLPAGRVFVALNSNTIAAPYNAFGGASYSANAFAEAAIDLTALIGGFDPCESVGFKTIMIKTKASSSSSASIEDFIDPIAYNLTIGPGANAGPDQVRCSEGAETSFPLAGLAASGALPIASNVWSVVSGSTTIDNPFALSTTARVTSGSATLRLTVYQANGCTKSDDVGLAVQSQPACVITGPTTICPRTTNTFTAPAGMNTYAWSMSGNGFISGPTNQSTVTVIAGPNCGQSYSVALVTRSNVCTVSCATEVQVTDATPPLLTCPPDRVLDCPADTATNAMGVATATDSCSRAVVTYNDAVTSGCGVSKTIARTWTATDECGNAVSCTQNITVRDITPPTITCPPNVTLECPANISPAANGTATASDSCSAVTVTFSDSVAPVCGNARIITRTWRATDACGNAATCAQTLTVRDTTAPVITCPANVTIECGSSTAPNSTGTATATDTCGSATVTYSDTSVPICGNSRIITRTWRATDACTNQSTCVQSITVLDRTPPTIGLRVVCTYSQGGWSGGGTPAALLVQHYTTVFPQGVMLGAYNPGNGNGAPNGLFWQPNAAGLNALQSAFSIGGGSSGAITQDAVNPATTYGAAGLGRQTLALTMNISFNEAGYLGAGPNNFGSIVYTKPGDSLSGKTVREILAVANQALAGLGLPAGHDFSSLTSLINELNISFHDCVTSSFAKSNLSLPGLLVNCASQIPAADSGLVTYSDACNSVTLTSLPEAITNQICPNKLTILRTWIATDACSNSASASMLVIVNDEKPPTISCPANVTVDYPASVDPSATGTATAADNCGAVNVNFADSTVPGAGNARTITRTWTALDACNNTTNCIQVITVRDTTPPLNRLTISANGPTGVLLRWPPNAVDYRLECAAVSEARRWYPVPVTPVITNGECRVYLTKPGHCQFFRLANTPPYLEGAKLSGGNLRLTWPTVPSGFVLEASDAMAAGSWTPVAITPGVSNALNHVTVPALGNKKFYRLRK